MLTVSVVLLISLLMTATTVLDIRRERAVFRQELERRGLLMSSTLNDIMFDELYFADVAELDDIARIVTAQPGILYIQVFTPDGRLLVDTQQEGTYASGRVDDQFALSAVLGRLRGFRVSGDVMEVASPIEIGSDLIGGVRFGFATDTVEAEIRAITGQRIWQTLTLIVVGTVISYVMAQHLVRPIRRLVRATHKIAEGELEFSSLERRSDEIGDLSVAFQEMTGAIGASRAQLEERSNQVRSANEELLGEIDERRRAEEALQRANEELEARVAERTDELVVANQRLQAELGERWLAEQRIKASLGEKEVLLKEINHRVKNNLQLISSLLSLQSGRIVEEEAREGFKESQNRVSSMALIHEKLYESEDLARIDFVEYIRHLAPNLFHAYGVDSDAIKLKLSVDEVALGVDTAIPCGLIINELISNSLKHAFPGGRKGEISITLRSQEGDKLTLALRDNGVGLPKDLDFRNTPSLGLQLVNTLTDQLGGTIELSGNGGAEFTITFTP